VPEGYPVGLEREVVHADGTRYHVRPIRPDDADRLAAFHATLSTRSTYLRFFRVHPVLTPGELEQFTHVDYRDRLALVAEDADRLLAVGRYDRLPGDGEAEIAFVVSDEYQHHGIGALLLDELARAGWDRGITIFVAETLAENRPMIDVFSSSGFPVTSTREYDTVILRFPVEPTPTYRKALARREATRGAAAPC
jgi:GNAT superfamily N-acetyltransferase